jgi:NADPH:quinone reductase
MRAVIVDPDSAGRLVLGDVEQPSPGSTEALVRVKAISLNRGEVRRSMAAAAGWRPGWDLAGTVERAAADGSGPPVGAQVVGLLNSGAWAEVVAVPSNFLAVIPDRVSLAQASTLPVAGLTALYVLERGGSLLDRSILITGASGGVGHFACQLAKMAGARVTGLVSQEKHADFVRGTGVHQVVVGDGAEGARPFGPYHLVVDSVGGRTLSDILTMLAHNGTCVSFGVSSGAESTIDVSKFYLTGGASLYGFILFYELGRESASFGLGRLLNLVADGRLKTHIEIESSWRDVADVARQLMERRFVGKAVLHVD